MIRIRKGLGKPCSLNSKQGRKQANLSSGWICSYVVYMAHYNAAIWISLGAREEFLRGEILQLQQISAFMHISALTKMKTFQIKMSLAPLYLWFHFLQYSQPLSMYAIRLYAENYENLVVCCVYVQIIWSLFLCIHCVAWIWAACGRLCMYAGTALCWEGGSSSQKYCQALPAPPLSLAWCHSLSYF